MHLCLSDVCIRRRDTDSLTVRRARLRAKTLGRCSLPSLREIGWPAIRSCATSGWSTYAKASVDSPSSAAKQRRMVGDAAPDYRVSPAPLYENWENYWDFAFRHRCGQPLSVVSQTIQGLHSGFVADKELGAAPRKLERDRIYWELLQFFQAATMHSNAVYPSRRHSRSPTSALTAPRPHSSHPEDSG